MLGLAASTGTPHFIALLYCASKIVPFFFKTNLKVCGNPVSSGDRNIFKLRHLHYF